MNDSFPERTITVNGEQFAPFLRAAVIQKRLDEIAERIDADYSGRRPIFICVLNGAFMFFSDLVRRITIDCEVDFIRLSSYAERKVSSGHVRLVKDLNCDVHGRDIILVEDIVDTGLSIDYIKRYIELKNPASLAVVTLLHKPAHAKIVHHLDYVGFEIPPRFVIGYGLDYAQQGRNLPEIYILPENGADAGKTGESLTA